MILHWNQHTNVFGFEYRNTSLFTLKLIVLRIIISKIIITGKLYTEEKKHDFFILDATVSSYPLRKYGRTDLNYRIDLLFRNDGNGFDNKKAQIFKILY